MPLSAKNMTILNSVDSTNIYAMEMVKKGLAEHGSSVFAINQIKGKGRAEKSWNSEPGSNVILSVIANMEDVSITRQPYFSMWASLCAAELIEHKAGLKAFVKWPNDVFINDKKAVGILIENVIRGKLWQWTVAGFGINVNQTDFKNHQRATSLRFETGKSFDVMEMATELKEALLAGISDGLFQHPAALLGAYNKHLYKRGEMVKMQAGSRIFETTIEGVNERGMLITRDSFEREWRLDEVKMKL